MTRQPHSDPQPHVPGDLGRTDQWAMSAAGEPRTAAGMALLMAYPDIRGRVALRDMILAIEAEAARLNPRAEGRLDADFIRAVQALTEEVYVTHHTPSSESGPEEWDVELLAPESETVERVIRHLTAYGAAASEEGGS